MKTAGCDIGSLFMKAAVLDGDRLLGWRAARTTGNASSEVPALLKAAISDAGLSEREVECLGATGSGARLVAGADFTEEMLNCVAAACCWYLPEVRLVVDIGGQSITSILLDDEGEVLNFMRNDKCASGSGRFLEVIGDKLEVPINEIDAAVGRSQKTLDLSNQCGVFAESEVITHVNNGEPTPDILAGACHSAAKMVAAQSRKFGQAGCYTLTGGVVKIGAVTRMVAEKLGGNYRPFPFDPQLAAAIGAALLGDPD